jgi:hypothetical protein
MMNLKEQGRRKLSSKLALIVMAFIIIIATIKVITLRNASCYRSFVASIRAMIIIWINAQEKTLNTSFKGMCL